MPVEERERENRHESWVTGDPSRSLLKPIFEITYTHTQLRETFTAKTTSLVYPEIDVGG